MDKLSEVQKMILITLLIAFDGNTPQRSGESFESVSAAGGTGFNSQGQAALGSDRESQSQGE